MLTTSIKGKKSFLLELNEQEIRNLLNSCRLNYKINKRGGYTALFVKNTSIVFYKEVNSPLCEVQFKIDDMEKISSILARL